MKGKDEIDFCFCTVAVGRRDGSFDRFIRPNFENYCEEHNYDFYCLENSIPLDFDNNAYKETNSDTLYKIEFIEKMLEFDNDYVVFMDAFDTLITNKFLGLDNFIDNEHSIFFSTDINEWDIDVAEKTNNVNTGFSIYKNDQFSKNFISSLKEYKIEWDSSTRHSVNDQVIVQNLLADNDELYENVALGDPLQERYWFYNKPNFYSGHELLYKQHKSPWLWEEGDFMIHFAGQPCRGYLIHEFHEYITSDEYNYY